MKLVSIILALVVTLLAITPATPGTKFVWLDQAIGDSLVSGVYSNVQSGARGKHFAQYVITGHADSCELLIYKEYSNYVKSGAFIWSCRQLVDSLTAPFDTLKYLPVYGSGYFRFIVKPWGDWSETGTEIDFILEIK